MNQNNDDLDFTFKRRSGGDPDGDMKVVPSGQGARRYTQRETPPHQARRAPEPEPPRRSRRRESKLSRFTKSFLIICADVGIAIFLAIFALSSASDLSGLGQRDRQIEVTISEEDAQDPRKVSSILKESGVISEKLTFDIYASIKLKKDIQPGTYVLNDKWGYDQIMNRLTATNDGDTADVVTVTFPEGSTQRDIGELLEEKGVCTAEDFYNALENESYDYEFVSMLPENELRFRKFEGYLFPDTYEFYVDMNPAEVARKFFDNFENRVMNDEMKKEILNSDLGQLDKTIILASIIQKEAGTPEEMQKVSAVFHNRLNDLANYPNLQSDATADYIRDDIKAFMTTINQEIIDAYDSTKVRGLPAGPICNPGMDAIEAALHPADLDAYFFVSDNEGTYYYAKTDAEHEQNKALAAEVNKKLKEEEAAAESASEETGE